MRGLILAAGRGSRMGAATRDRPKGMVALCGRPLIAWQLDALGRAGVEEIAVVRGYRGDALPFAVTYLENPRWAETSIASSLACAERWLAAGPTIVSYADIVYPPELLHRLIEARGDLVLAYDTNWLELWRRRFDDPLEDAETFRVDERGFVREIGGRPGSLAEIRGQYMGLFALSPRGSARLLGRFHALEGRERDRIDMTGLLGLLVREGEAIRTVPFDGWWCEVDSPADLLLAEEIAERASPS